MVPTYKLHDKVKSCLLYVYTYIHRFIENGHFCYLHVNKPSTNLKNGKIFLFFQVRFMINRIYTGFIYIGSRYTFYCYQLAINKCYTEGR